MPNHILATLGMSILVLSAACRRDDSPKSPTSSTQPTATTPDESSRKPTLHHPAVSRPATTLTEDQKIEALIAALAKLEGATFIRNGTEHNVDEAVEHMRRKWAWKKDEIKTADDFIRIAATGSSITGKPYTIRFADGREVPSADWFRNRLDEMRRPDQ